MESNKIKEVIDSGLTSHERIFPIINKFDRIWNYHSEQSFVNVIEILSNFWYNEIDKKAPNDLEFTKLLDEYIQKYQIK